MSDEPEKITLFIDSSEKHEGLPEMGDHDLCPECKSELELGFGLAGGGYGPYTYCLNCGKVTSKSCEPIEDG